jgi:hypothetical protein
MYYQCSLYGVVDGAVSPDRDKPLTRVTQGVMPLVAIATIS